MRRVLTRFPWGFLAFQLAQLAALVAVLVYLERSWGGIAVVVGVSLGSAVSVATRFRWLSYVPGAFVVHRWLRSPVTFPVERLENIRLHSPRGWWQLATMEFLPWGELRFVPATGGFRSGVTLENLLEIPEVGAHFRGWFLSGRPFTSGIRTLRVEQGRLFVTDKELPQQMSFALKELEVETSHTGEMFLKCGVWSMGLGSPGNRNVWQLLLAGAAGG